MPTGARLLLVVYAAVIEAVVWLALAPAAYARALRRPNGRDELRQRLGWKRPSISASRGAIFIHAVSVGEMHSAEALVAELAARGERVWLTTGTLGGYEAATRIAAARTSVAGVSYLPWDRRVVRSWLNHAAPAAVVVIETEIWPNLFAACGDLGVPLFVASGRVRPQDVAKYRFLRPLFRNLLDIPAWIGVQSAGDRDAFIAIGAPAQRVHVMGGLKFDAALLPVATSDVLCRDSAASPLLVAGSTHAPEEEIVLEAARMLAREGGPIRVVLGPRDLSRVDAVERLARRGGLATRRWSEVTRGTDDVWDVMVLDRYNTLRECYASADVIMVGGTFAPIGGHNILEAAAAARPILVGPCVDGISAVAASFDAVNALWRLPGTSSSRALADACRALIDDPARARAMGNAARALCQQGAGSAARHAQAILATSRHVDADS